MTETSPDVPARIRYDADSHLMETPDWLAGYAEPGVRTRLRVMCPASLERSMKLALRQAAARRERPELLRRAVADPFAAPGWGAPGAVHPEERVHVLDALGFGAQLVFTTYAVNQFLPAADRDLLVGAVRAHNRGVADYCSVDARLLPVAIVPLEDGVTAATLLADALQAGCRAVWIPSVVPDRYAPSHPEFDRFWAMLQDADTPFLLHVGTDGGQLAPAFHANGRPAPKDILGGEENMRGKDFMVLPHLPATILAVIVLDGVLHRFPRLRGACIEYGASWTPAWLERMDRTHRFFRKSEEALAELTMKPSEYVQRQLKFTPDSSEQVARTLQEVGPDLLMFSTDYPHPEGGRDPIGVFEHALGGESEAVRERFFSGNFADLMGSRLP